MMNKNSPTETKFREMASKRGYKALSKGYPDYVIEKDGKIIFVECKRRMIRKTLKMGFSKHQLEMRKILERLGLNYKVFRGEWDID